MYKILKGLTLLDPTYILSSWDPGGSFLPNPFYHKIQQVLQLAKQEVFSTKVASSPVKLAAQVRFPEGATILEDFFLVTQSLRLNFWKIKISKNI